MLSRIAKGGEDSVNRFGVEKINTLLVEDFDRLMLLYVEMTADVEASKE